MISKYIFFICFIFLIGLGSSATLSMSPSQIEFGGNTGDLICQKVTLKVNGSEILSGKTQWAEEGYNERRLVLHNLNSEEIGLDIEIPEILEIYDSEEIDVCLEGKRPGNFHGVLLYRIEEKSAQVGIWMNVTLEGNSLVKITGNFVRGDEGIGDYMMTVTVLLVLVLGGLIFWSFRKKQKKLDRKVKL